jgi:HlyD family secretion protein
MVYLLMILSAFIISACSLASSGPLEQQMQASMPELGQEVAPTVTPIPTAPSAARPVHVVERGNVEEVLTFSGRWMPRDQEQLAFQTSGTVRQVTVRQGDAVTVGQMLADLQITDLENQLTDALINLETVEMRLSTGSEGSEQAVIDAAFGLAEANMSLDGARNSYSWTSIDDARRGINAAERALEAARRNYNDVISRPDSNAGLVDNALEGIKSAEDSLAQAWSSYYSVSQNWYQNDLNVARSENAVIRSQMALERAQAGVGVDPEQLQSLRQAQIQVQRLQEQINNSTLVSSIEGVVLEVSIQQGTAVDAYKTVITIGIPEPKEAIANLAFNDTQRLNEGQIGVCQEANRPETAVQCIIRRLPLTNRDADQTVRVAATLPDIALGRLIDIRMPLQSREVLWLPPAAVRTFQNRTFVVIEGADGQRVVDITIGLRTNDRVEVTSGLQEGDQVVMP